MKERRVTWAASVPILVFLSLSVLDLGPMYATDIRQTSVSLLNVPAKGTKHCMMRTLDSVIGSRRTVSYRQS